MTLSCLFLTTNPLEPSESLSQQRLSRNLLLVSFCRLSIFFLIHISKPHLSTLFEFIKPLRDLLYWFRSLCVSTDLTNYKISVSFWFMFVYTLSQTYSSITMDWTSLLKVLGFQPLSPLTRKIPKSLKRERQEYFSFVQTGTLLNILSEEKFFYETFVSSRCFETFLILVEPQTVSIIFLPLVREPLPLKFKFYSKLFRKLGSLWNTNSLITQGLLQCKGKDKDIIYEVNVISCYVVLLTVVGWRFSVKVREEKKLSLNRKILSINSKCIRTYL